MVEKPRGHSPLNSSGGSLRGRRGARVVILAEARRDCFSQCDVGADVVGLQVELGNATAGLLSAL